MDVDFYQQLFRHGFAQDDIEHLLTIAKPLELPTKHILVNQGEYADEFYFVLQGVCHACYLTEQGKQFSKEFYWEKDWVIGFESLINHQPSPYLLETLTPVQLLCIPMQTLQKWRDNAHPIYLKLLETQLRYKENKERFMLLHSPQQRYQLLCQHFPELCERINEQHIAAYLGITPISLSRIKARINAKASAN